MPVYSVDSTTLIRRQSIGCLLLLSRVLFLSNQKFYKSNPYQPYLVQSSDSDVHTVCPFYDSQTVDLTSKFEVITIDCGSSLSVTFSLEFTSNATCKFSPPIPSILSYFTLWSRIHKVVWSSDAFKSRFGRKKEFKNLAKKRLRRTCECFGPGYI